MVVPNFTVGAPGPAFSSSQLAFAAVVSLVLYGSFVFVQTVRHRDYPPLESGDVEHASSPPANVALSSLGLPGFLGSRRGPCQGSHALSGGPNRIAWRPEGRGGYCDRDVGSHAGRFGALQAARANRLQTSRTWR